MSSAAETPAPGDAPPADAGVDTEIAAATDTIEAIIAVLDEETAAVSGHNMTAVQPLQLRKAALTETYAQQLHRLSRRAGGLAQAHADSVARLTEARNRLSAALNTNIRQLDISRQAARRVFDVISETARRTVSPVEGYNRGGKTDSGLGNRALSITVNGRF